MTEDTCSRCDVERRLCLSALISRVGSMDTQLLERTRSMLRTRVESARTCPERMFGVACAHILVWLQKDPFLAPKLDVLAKLAREREIDSQLQSRPALAALKESRNLIPTSTWEELAALNFAGLKLIAGRNVLEEENHVRGVARGLCGTDHHKISTVIEVLRTTMLWGLHAYLDEALDGQVAVLALLKKYKERSEWYRRAELRELAAPGTRFQGRRVGEPSLMMDLYEYVHDQGVNFRIESWSASGEADLVSDGAEGQRLVLDGKYVRPEDTPREVEYALGRGLRQVRDYCLDHNETTGYLVVYVEKDLAISITGAAGLFPAVRIGAVTVSCVFVNIFRYSKPASKRPPADVLTIEESSLVRAIEAVALSRETDQEPQSE